jgi:hypothetical protein
LNARAVAGFASDLYFIGQGVSLSNVVGHRLSDEIAWPVPSTSNFGRAAAVSVSAKMFGVLAITGCLKAAQAAS